jgi:hypothetical protein
MAKSDVTRLMVQGNPEQGWEVLVANGARPAPHWVRGRVDTDRVVRIMKNPRVQMVLVTVRGFDDVAA